MPFKNATPECFFPLIFISRKDSQKSFLLIYLREKVLENSNVPAFILDELGGNVKSQERSQTAPVAERCLDYHLGPSAKVQHGLVTAEIPGEKDLKESAWC